MAYAMNGKQLAAASKANTPDNIIHETPIGGTGKKSVKKKNKAKKGPAQNQELTQ